MTHEGLCKMRSHCLCESQEAENIKRAVREFFRAKEIYFENQDTESERLALEAELRLRKLLEDE